MEIKSAGVVTFTLSRTETMATTKHACCDGHALNTAENRSSVRSECRSNTEGEGEKPFKGWCLFVLSGFGC